MPNLKRIIQDGLGLAPDVYMRDYVGDTGDVHAGAISASPDVIVRPAAVPNPEVTFGPTTAGDTTLGFTVTSGRDNFVYVRVWNRGGVPATNVKAKVFYASAATLLTFDDWTLIGEVTILNVPPGNVMTVSGPITWPTGALPPPGHYCFIALVGNAQDPAPDGADFQDLDYYYAYIRTNNNVTWRNFDVVAALAPAAPDGLDVENDAYDFEFAAPGAADRDRYFQLAVGSRLPPGSRVWLEAPAALLDHPHLPLIEMDTERRMARMPIGPHGRTTLPRVLFPARSRSRCRLLLQVPRAHRDRDHETYVSQLYDGDHPSLTGGQAMSQTTPERNAPAPLRFSTAELAARHATLLRAEQVRLLYANSGIALVTTPVAATTLAVVSSGLVPPGLTIAWLGYVLSVAAARALIVRRFQRLPPDVVDVAVWCRRFVAGAAAAGLGWGAAGILFFSDTSVPWQMFLALVLAGVAMASVPVLAPVMAAFLAFTIPTLLPITGRFLLQGQPTGLGMAVLGVVFGGGLAFGAWRMHQAIVRALLLAFENRELVTELARQHHRHPRTARDELEQRVRERTRNSCRFLEEQKRARRDVARDGAEPSRLIKASPLATSSSTPSRRHNMNPHQPQISWTSAGFLSQTILPSCRTIRR